VRLANVRQGFCALLALVLAALAAAGCGEREQPAPRVEVTTPPAVRSGNIVISYVLYDAESAPAAIYVTYSLDGGLTYSEATGGAGGDGTALLLTSERGVAHSYVWDSIADARYVNEDNVRISIAALTRRQGLPSVTGTFPVENFIFGEWEPNIRVDDDAGVAVAESPRLCAEGDSIYAVWTDYRNGNADIYFASSLDAGTTWSTSIRVCDDAGTSAQTEPSIGSDGSGTVYIIWTDYRNGDSDIYMTSGSDPGSGFAFVANSQITSASAVSPGRPDVAVEGSDLCVTFADSRSGNRDIYFVHSPDSGASWEPEVLVNDDGGSADQYEPVIEADGSGGVYLAWTDARNGNYDIYTAAASAPGFVFGPNVRADDDAIGAAATEPSVAVHGANVYVAYTDMRNFNYDVYVASSVDSAATFSTSLRACDDTGICGQYQPSLAVDSSTGELYLVFTDDRIDGPSIYFTSSPSPGAPFGPTVRVDDDRTAAVQSQPEAVFGSRVFVIFADARNANGDIYFTRRPKN
jgi:hypothetical protein